MLHTSFKTSLYFAILTLLTAPICFATASDTQQRFITFQDGEAQRHAVLTLPSENKDIKGSVIFVHGDGPTNSFANGYYEPIWTTLAHNGIASLSWDKPGVDGADGNWLAQSMNDRANTVLAAYNKLKSIPNLADKSIGLIGFSQASWVMPKALRQVKNIDFAVFISTPINWIEQSNFTTVLRLNDEGRSDAFITQQLEYDAHVNDFISSGANFEEYQLFIQDNIPPEFRPSKMQSDRYEFVQKNMLSDSSDDLLAITQPISLMLAEHDTHIDIEENIIKYSELFKERDTQLSDKIYQNALHSMLKTDEFANITSPIWAWLKMIIMGEQAFQPEFLPDLVDWISVQIEEHHR